MLKFSKSFLIAWNIVLSLFSIASTVGPGDVNENIFFGVIAFFIIYWIISLVLIKKVNIVLRDSVNNQNEHTLFSFGILMFFLIPTFLFSLRQFIPLIVHIKTVREERKWIQDHCNLNPSASNCYKCDDERKNFCIIPKL